MKNNKNKKIEGYIKLFIDSIIERYNTIKVSYLYDSYEDMFYIYHNDLALENDIEFKSYVGDLMKSILLKNNVSNFAFDYDYDNVILKPRISLSFHTELTVEEIRKRIFVNQKQPTYTFSDYTFDFITINGYNPDNSKGNNYISSGVAA